jgi:hypothetical protein
VNYSIEFFFCNSPNDSATLYLYTNSTTPSIPSSSNCIVFSEFEDDPDLYVLKPLQYVGIEVWQVANIVVDQTFVLHHNSWFY